MAAGVKSWLLICCLTVLISGHQLLPQATAAPASEHALLTHIKSEVARSGGAVIAGGGTSGLGGSGGKKPGKVKHLTGLKGHMVAKVRVFGSYSHHGGSGTRGDAANHYRR